MMMPFECTSVVGGSDIIVLYVDEGLVYFADNKGKMDFMSRKQLRENYLYSHHILTEVIP